ncbi:fatty acid synthase [Bemisia tabaci]|uniref:fatty acid synthase n=1 Tax=Bemisia tabaci TaxID=7038 RepID=UPI003B27F042
MKISRDWTVYLDRMINLNIMWNAQATGQLPRPASIQSIKLDPEQVDRLKTVSDVEFFLNTAVNCLQCIGITINGFKTNPVTKIVEKLDDVHAERLNFVPYGNSTFKNLQEFWRASFQVMSENSDSSTTKFRIPLDFKISDKRNGKSPPSPSKILNDFLQAGNDSNKTSGWKPKIYHVSENVFSTLDTLKLEAKTANEKLVLVFNRPSFKNPEGMIRKILRKAGKTNYRFLFLLDDHTIPFSLNESFYLEQLEKGVVVNVLKNGKWGGYYGTPISKPVPENVAKILPHFDQASEEVDLHYIGLNPSGLHNMTKGSPAISDYSGVTAAGAHVIGIAHKNEGFESNIRLDSIFQWTVSKDLPLDEAASLPSAYLMAHSILEERMAVRIVNDTDGTTKKTAFIMGGQTPVGMALISLCLERNYNVFTTVPNEAAYQLVSFMFPQIPRSSITNHSNEDFYVPVMLGTNGIGPDIIVSDAPRKPMLTAWACIGKHGSFVNLNEETMQHNTPLPMGRFSKDTGYYGLKLSQLVQLPKERKIQLHELVSKSLSSGRIVHMPHKSVDVNNLSQLSRTAELVTEQGGKLLLDVGSRGKNIRTSTSDNKCDKQREWITPKDSQVSSVIISSSVGKVVKLVEWLLERGVKNIVLSTSDAGDIKAAVRTINNATSRHEATLLMTSAKAAHTPAGVENVLNQATRLGTISTIFTVSLDKNDTLIPVIQRVMTSFPNDYTLINIQGETWAHEMKNMVTIVCNDDVSYCDVLSQALTDPDKPATYVVSDKNSSKENDSDVGVQESILDYLPSSLQELEEMGESLCHSDSRLSPQIPAAFIQTSSLAAKLSGKHIEALPVFIIPAFCETQLRPLLSRFMYSCYVAHIHPQANSAQQIAEHLFAVWTAL